MAHNMQLNTKTGYIKLQVPPHKLGAVLGAIGAALDGHPWTPYTASKPVTRGCRGGRGKREGNLMAPLRGGHGSPATNPLGRTSVGGVPQLPTSLISPPSVVLGSDGIPPTPVQGRKMQRVEKAPVEPCKSKSSPVVERVKAAPTVANVGSSKAIGKLPGAMRRDIYSPANSVTESQVQETQVNSAKSVVVNTPLTKTPSEIESVDDSIPEKIGKPHVVVSSINREPLGGTSLSNRFEAIQEPEGGQHGVKDVATAVSIISDQKWEEVKTLKHILVERNSVSPTAVVCNHGVRYHIDGSRNKNWKCNACNDTIQKAERLAKEHNAKWTVPSHLAVCGNTCVCRATRSKQYMDLLSKHRRLFVQASAEDSRKPNTHPKKR